MNTTNNNPISPEMIQYQSHNAIDNNYSNTTKITTNATNTVQENITAAPDGKMDAIQDVLNDNISMAILQEQGKQNVHGKQKDPYENKAPTQEAQAVMIATNETTASTQKATPKNKS